MLTIFAAKCTEDFEVAARLCLALAEWDASVGPAYDLTPEMVMEIFHGDCSSAAIEAQFGSPDSRMFVARWHGQPAGCLGIDPFDDNTHELHKFYVDPKFRGKGIGTALLQTVLIDVAKDHRKVVHLHTAIYMRNAIALYERAGFALCPRFRAIPAEAAHTDVFMSRVI